jgi:hypothetical protein
MSAAPRHPTATTRAASNVVRLPTAAKRKVNNHRCVAQSWAAKMAREEEPWPGTYLAPSERRGESPMPAFDPNNPAHVAAWESLCRLGMLQEGR